jgi:hypothetical protein
MEAPPSPLSSRANPGSPTASLHRQSNLRKAPPYDLSSRPKRSEVEGSAVFSTPPRSCSMVVFDRAYPAGGPSLAFETKVLISPDTLMLRRTRSCVRVCLPMQILIPRQNKGLSGRVDPIEMMGRRGQHFWNSRSDRRRHSPSLDPSPNEAIRVVYSVGLLRAEGRLRRTIATHSAHAFSLG